MLIDRTGSPPPRMRSKSSLPVASRSRLRSFAFTDPLGWREDSPLVKPGNLLEAADDDLARQLYQQRPELGEQFAQRNRRVLDLPDQGPWKLVGVSVGGPQDCELAELRAAGRCPPRRSREKRGRGGGAENLCHRIPDQLEQRSTAQLGAGIVSARSSAVRNARRSHLPPPCPITRTSLQPWSDE